MKIAMIGAGNVGRTLGLAFARCGHEVTFGVRDRSSPKVAEMLAAASGCVSVSDVAAAARQAEVIALATPWTAAEGAVRAAGNLSGKVILDCTNPLKEDLSGLAVGDTTSGAELVASWAMGSRVVKVFNTIGYENMADPSFGSQAATMLMAGDDEEAKLVAAQLSREIGFAPVDVGPLADARLLESLALLWIVLAVKRGHGTRIAFQLLRK